MRAMAVQQYGGPEALVEVDLDPEPLGGDEIRIAVTCAAVSPTDTALRSGFYSEADAPSDEVDVPGMDVVGRVVDLGPDIGERQGEWISVGDRVMGVVVPQGQHGAYRSDLVLPADSVTAAPQGASDEAASTLPMNGLTAMIALDELALEAGQWVAVTGAAGAFGGYVVQLAVTRGLRVIADASRSDRELISSFGAHVVLERGEGFAAACRREVPEGVDGLVDGSVQGEEVLGAVKDGGAVVTVRGWAGPQGGHPRDLSFHPVLVHGWARRRDLLDLLRVHAENGDVTLRVADVLPAAEAAEAHRRLEAGGVRGRLVLDFR